MRIISGTHKGRRINPPKNLPVRPTTDMAKEGLFNILNNLVDYTQLNVLDLFAGTGSISLEFASRGVLSVVSVDKNYRCIEFLRKISDDMGFNNIKTIRSDVLQFLNKPFSNPFDLIFSDAPYQMQEIPELPDMILDRNYLKENAWLIIEHPKKIDFARHKNIKNMRHYGSVCFSFFVQD